MRPPSLSLSYILAVASEVPARRRQGSLSIKLRALCETSNSDTEEKGYPTTSGYRMSMTAFHRWYCRGLFKDWPQGEHLNKLDWLDDEVNASCWPPACLKPMVKRRGCLSRKPKFVSAGRHEIWDSATKLTSLHWVSSLLAQDCINFVTFPRHEMSSLSWPLLENILKPFRTIVEELPRKRKREKNLAVLHEFPSY